MGIFGCPFSYLIMDLSFNIIAVPPLVHGAIHGPFQLLFLETSIVLQLNSITQQMGLNFLD